MISLFFVATLALAGTGLGCHHDNPPVKGPAERAGQKVDDAAHETKEGAEDATHAVGKGVEKTGKEIKKAGD